MLGKSDHAPETGRGEEWIGQWGDQNHAIGRKSAVSASRVAAPPSE